MSLLALHINKSIGPLNALTYLSFEVGHSEVVDLLGDNGAGKSTMVNILSGIHRPNSGYISVDEKCQDFANRPDSTEAGIETTY